MTDVRIERMRPGHWPAVRAIYEAGIAVGNATLEREVPEWEAWNAGHRPDGRFVAVDGDRVLGWIALAPYSGAGVLRRRGLAERLRRPRRAGPRGGQRPDGGPRRDRRRGRDLDADGRRATRERGQPGPPSPGRVPADRRPAPARTGRDGPLARRRPAGAAAPVGLTRRADRSRRPARRLARRLAPRQEEAASAMFYVSRGRVPHKRHTQFRTRDGVAVRRGAVRGRGLRRAQLAALPPWCRRPRPTGSSRSAPVALEEADDGVHRHRLINTAGLAPKGDAITGRVPLFFNADVTFGVVRPAEPMPETIFYRNGEADEMLFVHEGTGLFDSVFGPLRYGPGDYIVIPIGTTWRLAPDAGSAQRMLWLECPSEIEPPKRYRNDYGQLLEHSPYSQRDIRVPQRRPGADRGRRVPGPRQGARPADRVPLHDPPVRRRRLGRLPLAVHLQHRRLRADHRPGPPAAAGPPDVPGPQLRRLLVRAAQVRLPPAGDPGAVQPLEHQQRRGHLLRRRQLHEPARRGDLELHAPPGGHPARARTRARSRRRSARRRRRSWR